MLDRLTAWWSKLRRTLSRSEWLVRWFRLPRGPVSDAPGLVMVQIDGLSHCELQRAIQTGKTPFMESLLRREHYRLHRFYSGIPSTTPAVQGELFYGQRCAVPAFGFIDGPTGESVRMFSPVAAHRVQAFLSKNVTGLLEGGSAYCNIYDGGAEETHFCAASFGWSRLMSEVHPVRLATGLVWYIGSLCRAAGLAAIELVLATAGFVHRRWTGKEFWQELLMIPSRIVVSVLLRELCVIGASIDMARGLPIIHLNLLGYDEQAHRRGPASPFAHWSLKGIDHAIARLASAASRSERRHYDVWIYSDHGQESTIPYPFIAGKSIQVACRSAVARTIKLDRPDAPEGIEQYESPRASGRARWLSASTWVSRLLGEVDPNHSNDSPVTVTAVGPIGHVYIRSSNVNPRPTSDQLAEIAQRLVTHERVPMVAYRTCDRGVQVVVPSGVYDLDSNADVIFGSHHPFLSELKEDFQTLCHHPSAGDLVLGGWLPDTDPISFVLQNGAHGGVGSIETAAFALIPSSVPLHESWEYVRPERLRTAALATLKRPEQSSPGLADSARRTRGIRVMTYNVHGCLGLDGKLSPTRIAKVIAQANVDVIALQEVDVGRRRSLGIDQAHQIAGLLSMEHHFHAAWQVREERYGIAVLSRLPLRKVKSGWLPQSRLQRERRCVRWVEVQCPGGDKVQLLNTHLSI